MSTFVVKARGPRGLATVKVNKDKIVVAYDGGDTFAILPEDAPETISSGQYFVSLNADKNKIYGITPPPGSYICRFAGFLRDKDKNFVIKDKPFQDFGTWKSPQHLEYYPTFEVTGKKCTGSVIIHSLYWVFKEHESGQVMITGTGMGRVKDFLEVCGLDFDKDDTPYKESPQELLAMYEKLLKSKDVEVAVKISEKGYVESLSEVPQ